MVLVGDVSDRNAVLVDDIADTCGTLALAAKVLKDHGAITSTAIVTHGFLSGPSLQVIEESELDCLVVSNTLPLPKLAEQCSKIRQMDISQTFAEAIRRTYNGESYVALPDYSLRHSKLTSLQYFSSFQIERVQNWSLAR